MILYHGSTLIVEHPRIITSEYFGFAFYTTDIQAQAERWAVRKAKAENRKPGRKAVPIVSVFDWNVPQGSLVTRSFPDPDLEWLKLVVRCRSDIDYRHGFDIVEGKIANDNVGETVSYVVAGIMRREDAVERLKFERINNQVAFCTEAALTTLSFVKSYRVEV